MKKLKGLSQKMLDSSEFQKILSREEKKRILGGYDDSNCQVTERATTSHSCDPCGIDKLQDNGPGVCCIAC